VIKFGIDREVNLQLLNLYPVVQADGTGVSKKRAKFTPLNLTFSSV
jgi:hypothetical protein